MTAETKTTEPLPPAAMAPERFKGYIDRWRPDSDYGFIVARLPGRGKTDEFFCHKRSVSGRRRVPPGLPVEFEVDVAQPSIGKKRPQAINVTVLK